MSDDTTMNDSDRAMLIAIADGYRASRTWRGFAWGIIAPTFRTCMLWMVPFAILWAVGVDPVLAARVALGPMACVLVGVLIMMSVSGIIIRQIADKIDDEPKPTEEP